MRPLISVAIGLAFLSLIGAFVPQSARASEVKRGTKARIYGDATRGREIATKWCRSCHGAQVSNATDQIPTFAAIAAGPMGRPDTLRAFLDAPHKPMPPLQLTNQEIEDLVTFICLQK